MFKMIREALFVILLALLSLFVVAVVIAVASIGLARFVHWLTPGIEMGTAFLGSTILIIATGYTVVTFWRFAYGITDVLSDLEGTDMEGIDIDEEELDDELPFGLKLARPDPRNPGQYRIIDPIDLMEDDEPTFPRSPKRRSSRKRR